MEEVRIALRNVGKIRPDSIEDYLASGGYEALKKARTLDRGELIATIEETSRLRGRGGRQNISSVTPMRASPAPTRTASSWRETPIP